MEILTLSDFLQIPHSIYRHNVVLLIRIRQKSMNRCQYFKIPAFLNFDSLVYLVFLSKMRDLPRG
jgi:hypothetical protein